MVPAELPSSNSNTSLPCQFQNNRDFKIVQSTYKSSISLLQRILQKPDSFPLMSTNPREPFPTGFAGFIPIDSESRNSPVEVMQQNARSNSRSSSGRVVHGRSSRNSEIIDADNSGSFCLPPSGASNYSFPRKLSGMGGSNCLSNRNSIDVGSVGSYRSFAGTPTEQVFSIDWDERRGSVDQPAFNKEPPESPSPLKRCRRLQSRPEVGRSDYTCRRIPIGENDDIDMFYGDDDDSRSKTDSSNIDSTLLRSVCFPSLSENHFSIPNENSQNDAEIALVSSGAFSAFKTPDVFSSTSKPSLRGFDDCNVSTKLYAPPPRMPSLSPTDLVNRSIVVPPININPFTPEARRALSTGRTQFGSTLGKRRRSDKFFWSDADNETEEGRGGYYTTSRYRNNFEEIEQLGKGCFGVVYKCVGRIDGWPYAIKRSTRHGTNPSDKERMLREVYALAATGECSSFLRYYSAWIEDDQMYIQTELCEGRNLATRANNGEIFSEVFLKDLAVQVAVGLQHIHSLQMVHRDIKPENILCTNNGKFKIGDLGLMGFADGSDNFHDDEGDCRYLSRELLCRESDTCDLSKGDIFALGATLYELASGDKLPLSGDKWQNIRNGIFPPLNSTYSSEFFEFLRWLMHPDPVKRPSATDIILHPFSNCDYMSRISVLENENRRLNEELQKLIGDRSSNNISSMTSP